METTQDILTEWKGHLGCWKEQGRERPDTYSQAMIARLDEALLRERDAQERVSDLFRNGSVKDLPMDKVVQLAESSIVNLKGTTRAVWERILSEIKHGLYANGTLEYGVQGKDAEKGEDDWHLIELDFATPDAARNRAEVLNKRSEEFGVNYRPSVRQCSPWCEMAPKEEKKED